MSIFSFTEALGTLKGQMAKSKGRTKQNVQDEALVTSYSNRLTRSGSNRPVFEVILAELKADPRLTAAQVVAIAHRYALGSRKPSSKATALAAISKRFVEIVRFESKNKVAEKTRPW